MDQFESVPGHKVLALTTEMASRATALAVFDVVNGVRVARKNRVQILADTLDLPFPNERDGCFHLGRLGGECEGLDRRDVPAVARRTETPRDALRVPENPAATWGRATDLAGSGGFGVRHGLSVTPLVPGSQQDF